jgi:hypothetical protein
MQEFTEILNESVRHESDICGGHRLAHPLEHEDGTVLSIQASATHYCEPRETTDVANYNWYESFEIGFPSKVIEEILEYAEEPETPTDTVYSCVPKEVIRELIDTRGGVVGSLKGE